MVCDPQRFEAQMSLLSRRGFTTISVQELIKSVKNSKRIKEKSIVITFDDAYYSFYEHAYPILLKYKFSATVGVIVKKTKSNPGGIKKLGWEEMKECYQSGIADFQSHSYDLHNCTIRGCTETPEQSFESYRKMISEDYMASKYEIEMHLGNRVNCFIYPFGKSSAWSEAVLREWGCESTFITENKIAEVEYGNFNSLYTLPRLNVSNVDSPKNILKTWPPLPESNLLV